MNAARSAGRSPSGTPISTASRPISATYRSASFSEIRPKNRRYTTSPLSTRVAWTHSRRSGSIALYGRPSPARPLTSLWTAVTREAARRLCSMSPNEMASMASTVRHSLVKGSAGKSL